MREDKLVVLATTSADLIMAQRVAEELVAPLVTDATFEQPPFILRCQYGVLELVDTRPGAPGPLRIDFLSDQMLWRRRSGPELILKAVGAKPGYRPRVLDATAGLGRDAAVLVAGGCTVTMVERDPVLAQMLKAALASFQSAPEFAHDAARWTLRSGDARSVLQETGEEFEVVTLDPMFPERDKSAKVKKEMQYLQALVGEDTSGDELLELALARATRRVVVKRPMSAPPLGGRQPHHAHSGKALRFDVYLPRIAV